MYRGPAPPPGKPHRYHFVVYALDAAIAEKPNAAPLTRAELLDAARGHIIGRGELVATNGSSWRDSCPTTNRGFSRDATC